LNFVCQPARTKLKHRLATAFEISLFLGSSPNQSLNLLSRKKNYGSTIPGYLTEASGESFQLLLFPFFSP